MWWGVPLRGSPVTLLLRPHCGPERWAGDQAGVAHDHSRPKEVQDPPKVAGSRDRAGSGQGALQGPAAGVSGCTPRMSTPSTQGRIQEKVMVKFEPQSSKRRYRLPSPPLAGWPPSSFSLFFPSPRGPAGPRPPRTSPSVSAWWSVGKRQGAHRGAVSPREHHLKACSQRRAMENE